MKNRISIFLFLATLAQQSFGMEGVPGPGGSAPEPASILLVGIGIAAGGYAVYRSRRKS